MYSHQITNSIGDDIYNAFLYKDAFWVPHLHKSLEFTTVLEGELLAQVGDRDYRLTEGDCLLVTPYQPHGYHTESPSYSFIAVFAGSYVDAFARAIAGREADCAAFRLAEPTRRYLEQNMIFRSGTGSGPVCAVEKPPMMVLKACLYALCSEFMESVQLQGKPRDNRLIFDILCYIEQNYGQDISLYTLADALGYDYRYLSRIFHQTLKVSFKTLVNQYRCDRAKTLISSSDETLAQIAFSSGFQSIRSFNRVFRQMTGIMPSELRK